MALSPNFFWLFTWLVLFSCTREKLEVQVPIYSSSGTLVNRGDTLVVKVNLDSSRFYSVYRSGLYTGELRNKVVQKHHTLDSRLIPAASHAVVDLRSYNPFIYTSLDICLVEVYQEGRLHHVVKFTTK